MSDLHPDIFKSKQFMKKTALNIILVLNHVRPAYLQSQKQYLEKWDIMSEYLPNNIRLYKDPNKYAFFITLDENVEKLDEYFEIYKRGYAIGKILGYPYVGPGATLGDVDRYTMRVTVETSIWTMTLYTFMIPVDKYDEYKDDIDHLENKIASVLESMGEYGFDEYGGFYMGLNAYISRRFVPKTYFIT